MPITPSPARTKRIVDATDVEDSAGYSSGSSRTCGSPTSTTATPIANECYGLA